MPSICHWLSEDLTRGRLTRDSCSALRPSRAPASSAGRRSCASARALLLDEAVPLLTLTGPGGVGKTRLALAIAAGRVADHFADGVVWVDLAPLADPRSCPTTVAAALGLHAMAAISRSRRAWSRHLRRTQTLLLLDNCEHLLAAAAATRGATAGGLPRPAGAGHQPRAAARPRRARVLRSLPLPVPHREQRPTRDVVAQTAAVRLFVERARAVEPGFRLTDATTPPAVAEICRRLDGLPLAIELAAARVQGPPARGAAGALERAACRCSTGGARDLPPGSRRCATPSPGATTCCSAAEQRPLPPPRRLRRRLDAGGRGGRGRRWEPGRTSVLASADGAGRRQSGAAGRSSDDHAPRFGMLETVRVFAREQLVASGEEGELARSARRVVRGRGRSRRVVPWDYRPAGWFPRISLERGNIRAALDWLETQGDAALTLRLATCCGRGLLAGRPHRGRTGSVRSGSGAGGRTVPGVARARPLGAGRSHLGAAARFAHGDSRRGGGAGTLSGDGRRGRHRPRAHRPGRAWQPIRAILIADRCCSRKRSR